MLAKKNRFDKKKNFRQVLKEGRNFKEKFLTLKVTQDKTGEIRFGFIVSQRVSKKATIRNKVKRKISELVRLRIKKIRKGIDAILIALPGIEKKEFLEIGEMIDNLFKKAKIYESFKWDFQFNFLSAII